MTGTRTPAQLRRELAEEKKPQDGPETRSDPEQDRGRWPTRAEAAKLLGVSPATVKRMQLRGELQPELFGGVWRFDPDELGAFMGAEEEGSAAVVSQSVALTAQAQSHAEKLLELVTKPASRMLELLGDENEQLRRRNAELERKNSEMLDTAERALSRVHQRRLRELEFESSERVRDHALGLLRDVAPLVLAKMPFAAALLPTPADKGAAHAPVAGESGSTELPISAAVAQLSDEEFAAAAKAGNVPREQVALLAEVRELVRRVRRAQGAPATAGDLEQLECNALLLIADIDPERFGLLCRVATPAEVVALTEIRETIARVRAQPRV